jgi:hypothetical protein
LFCALDVLLKHYASEFKIRHPSYHLTFKPVEA